MRRRLPRFPYFPHQVQRRDGSPKESIDVQSGQCHQGRGSYHLDRDGEVWFDVNPCLSHESYNRLGANLRLCHYHGKQRRKTLTTFPRQLIIFFCFGSYLQQLLAIGYL